MKNEVLDTINRRRSTRDFQPEQISDEALAAIVEAGQHAPMAAANLGTLLSFKTRTYWRK